MNKQELLKVAREAGLPDPMVFYGAIERFAKLVIEIEQVGDADAMTATQDKLVQAMLNAAPPPLTDRERVLLDNLIQYWQDHAKQCDSITNRKMAERQKGWDLERVALLRKLAGIK